MSKKKELENLTATVILNQLALNYNESIKYTKFYKHNLKRFLNPAIRELMKAEKEEFDKVYDFDPDYTDQLSTNVMLIIEEICKGGFTDMVMLGNMICAFQKDRKKVSNMINEILNEIEIVKEEGNENIGKAEI